MVPACYIEISAAVRYWEDAYLNGVKDSEGRIPLRNGEFWEPVIELSTGKVVDWPNGVEARVHYKVCDSGLYWLQDAHRCRIGQWKRAYVPAEVLCPTKTSLGDYLILHINKDGFIEGWTPPSLVEAEWRLATETGA